MRKIIGLVGFIGSGKGTVAQHLVDKHNFRQESFASSLKDACSSIFDWPRDLLEGDTIESRQWRETTDIWWSDKLGIEKFTPRLALQLIGTNALRDHFSQDLWFLSLENRIRKNSTQDIIISDVRFFNEVAFIKKISGTLIHISRGPEPEWFTIAARADAGNQEAALIMKNQYSSVHPSEWSWAGSDIDYTIENNSTLQDLTLVIDSLIRDTKIA